MRRRMLGQQAFSSWRIPSGFPGPRRTLAAVKNEPSLNRVAAYARAARRVQTGRLHLLSREPHMCAITTRGRYVRASIHSRPGPCAIARGHQVTQVFCGGSYLSGGLLFAAGGGGGSIFDARAGGPQESGTAAIRPVRRIMAAEGGKVFPILSPSSPSPCRLSCRRSPDPSLSAAQGPVAL